MVELIFYKEARHEVVPGESVIDYKLPRQGKQHPIINVAEQIIITIRARRLYEEAYNLTFKRKQKNGENIDEEPAKKEESWNFFDV